MKKAGAVCVGLFWFWVRLVLGEVGSRGRLILCEVGVYFLFFTPTFWLHSAQTCSSVAFVLQVGVYFLFFTPTFWLHIVQMCSSVAFVLQVGVYFLFFTPTFGFTLPRRASALLSPCRLGYISCFLPQPWARGCSPHFSQRLLPALQPRSYSLKSIGPKLS